MQRNGFFSLDGNNRQLSDGWEKKSFHSDIPNAASPAANKSQKKLLDEKSSKIIVSTTTAVLTSEWCLPPVTKSLTQEEISFLQNNSISDIVGFVPHQSNDFSLKDFFIEVLINTIKSLATAMIKDAISSHGRPSAENHSSSNLGGRKLASIESKEQDWLNKSELSSSDSFCSSDSSYASECTVVTDHAKSEIKSKLQDHFIEEAKELIIKSGKKIEDDVAQSKVDLIKKTGYEGGHKALKQIRHEERFAFRKEVNELCGSLEENFKHVITAGELLNKIVDDPSREGFSQAIFDTLKDTILEKFTTKFLEVPANVFTEVAAQETGLLIGKTIAPVVLGIFQSVETVDDYNDKHPLPSLSPIPQRNYVQERIEMLAPPPSLSYRPDVIRNDEKDEPKSSLCLVM